MKSIPVQKKVIAFAGNPNVGKSTLFNALTGLHQHTGNWSGKTVGIAKGVVAHNGVNLELWDLPGTYSLEGGGEDEAIASACIKAGDSECTVVVCDANCLERTLILGLQIMAICPRVVVCVNLVDEAKKNGIAVDGEKLSKLLCCPVLLTSAGKGWGIDALLNVLSDHIPEVGITISDPIEEARRIASQCVTKNESSRVKLQRRIDRMLVSRGWGVVMMLLLLLLILWITIVGANYPSAWLEKVFGLGYAILKNGMTCLPDWLSGLLVDGAYATSARVLSVMLPPMAIFFPLFTCLEDVGYLPRIAFLLDGGMQRCGGCGKQALTLCMGLGCNAVGVMGCRILESPSQRLRAMLTNCMVPCNGRFPTLCLLAGLFFGTAYGALSVAACIVFGVFMAMLTSGMLSLREKTDQQAFLMELPPFRPPQIRRILVQSLLHRTLRICMRTLKVAAPAGVLMWLLARFSVLGKIAALLDPIGIVLGMNGLIILAFLCSIPANELFIPVILVVLSGAGSIVGVQTGDTSVLLQAGWSTKTVICTLIFTLLHWPCATTLMTVYQQTQSKKETAAAFFLPTAVGVLICLALNLLL